MHLRNKLQTYQHDLVKKEKRKFFSNAKKYNEMLCQKMLRKIEKGKDEKMNSDQKDLEHDKLLECLKRCKFPKGMEYNNAFAQVLGKENWWEFLYQSDQIVFEVLEATFDQLKEKSTFELITRKDSYDKRYLNYYLYRFIRAYFSEKELQQFTHKQYQQKIMSIDVEVTKFLKNNTIYLELFRLTLKNSEKETQKGLVQVFLGELLFLKRNCSVFLVKK